MHVGLQRTQAELLSITSMVHAIADHCEKNPSVAAFLDKGSSSPEEGLTTSGLELA